MRHIHFADFYLFVVSVVFGRGAKRGWLTPSSNICQFPRGERGGGYQFVVVGSFAISEIPPDARMHYQGYESRRKWVDKTARAPQSANPQITFGGSEPL